MSSNQLERGRLQLRFILGALLVLVLAPILSQWLRGGTDRFVSQLFTVLITVALFWQADRGAWWARHLTVALTFLGGVVAVILGLIVSLGSLWGYALFAVGLAFIGCGFALIALPDVDAYLRRRR